MIINIQTSLYCFLVASIWKFTVFETYFPSPTLDWLLGLSNVGTLVLKQLLLLVLKLLRDEGFIPSKFFFIQHSTASLIWPLPFPWWLVKFFLYKLQPLKDKGNLLLSFSFCNNFMGLSQYLWISSLCRAYGMSSCILVIPVVQSGCCLRFCLSFAGLGRAK